MKKIVLLISLIALASWICIAQTTVFNYQGKLGDTGSPANGTYQFQFKLFDAAGGNGQIGTTQSASATVTNGIFTTQLDFGSAAFIGQDRWLEISVRPGSSSPYTTLSPRKKLNSVPFAVSSQSAVTAANVSGVVAIANGGTGSAAQNFVDLTSNQTNISGNKTFAGTLSGNVVSTATQYNLGGNRILASSGGDNIFGGRTAGGNNTSGVVNSFFGSRSGEANVGGSSNSFFGERSGLNSQGINNSFFGAVAGQSNVSGGNNTAIGTLADVGAPNLNFATAIGAGAVVSSSNTIVLGRSVDTVMIPGTVFTTGSITRFDPALVATLRWDLLSPKSFPVGSSPKGVAFDGSNIWVANSGSNNVTKLRASDGVCVGTCTFNVGTNPQKIAFDGANMWVTNKDSNNVTKLRASDGVNLGTFPSGDSPVGIAFDGTSLWVTNYTAVGTVTKLQASDGAIVGTFPVGLGPNLIAFDGTNIWVATIGSGAFGNSTVVKLRASDGLVLAVLIVGPPETVGLALDGANIWVAMHGLTGTGNYVAKVRVSDAAILATFSYASDPADIAFDGANMWVTGSTVGKLGGGGEKLGTLNVGIGSSGIAFDGANMWITNSNGSTVTKVPVLP